MFFAPTLFKQTRPVDLILPLQNQLPQLQQIVGVDKLAPATSALSLSQIIADNTPLTTAITVHGDELAAVLFTSGTEGLPKGVMLTHNNILASERAYCARLNLTAGCLYDACATWSCNGLSAWRNGTILNWRSQRVVRYFHS